MSKDKEPPKPSMRSAQIVLSVRVSAMDSNEDTQAAIIDFRKRLIETAVEHFKQGKPYEEAWFGQMTSQVGVESVLVWKTHHGPAYYAAATQAERDAAFRSILESEMEDYYQDDEEIELEPEPDPGLASLILALAESDPVRKTFVSAQKTRKEREKAGKIYLQEKALFEKAHAGDDVALRRFFATLHGYDEGHWHLVRLNNPLTEKANQEDEPKTDVANQSD